MTSDSKDPTSIPDHFFNREDSSDDARFYAQPRMVTHIDDSTIEQLTEFYRSFLHPGQQILDLMSSWISHLPPEVAYKKVTGIGMNAEELAANQQLDQWTVQNLNTHTTLELPEASFDRALIAVSIQYLIQPVEVMKSVYRSLKTDGRICIATSHRLFPTKAIAAFRHLDPQARLQLIGTYLDRAGFKDVELLDRSPQTGDPLWIVVGSK